MRLCVLLRSAKLTTIGNNTLTIRTFLFSPPLSAQAHACTASFCVFFFYIPHRETEAHFPAAGMSSQRNHSDSFRFKRAAFYQSLKSKVGLAAAPSGGVEDQPQCQGCGIAAAPVHAPSRAPLLSPLLLSHNLPLPRVH
jgi:hypothetical protein